MSLHMKDAWNVLMNGLPAPVTVEKEVVGAASAVTLYHWLTPSGSMKITYPYFPGLIKVPDHDHHYAHTCEQAHAAADGAFVNAVQCVKVGKSYFTTASLKSLKVIPKPRAKV
jgi:hypothetical protein